MDALQIPPGEHEPGGPCAHTHAHTQPVPHLLPCSPLPAALLPRVPACSRAPAVPREHYARSRPPRNRRRGWHREGWTRCLCSQDAGDLLVSHGVAQWVLIRRLCSHPAAALRAGGGSKGSQLETQWGLLDTEPSESPEDSSQCILRASAGQKAHHPSPRSRCTQPRGLLAKPASHLGHKTAPWGWCRGTLGQQEWGCIRKGAKPVVGRAESSTVPVGGHVGGSRSRGRQCQGEEGVQRLGGGGAAADSARQLLSSA